MSRKAIVHIGPMKTGSTSIQLWLHQHREALLKAGVLFPDSLGGRNMSHLSYMAQAEATGTGQSEHDRRRLIALREEVAALPDSVHTVVFSGEMIAQQLNEEREVQALKTLFGDMFDDYLIVIYLRRQDELSLSRYSTGLRRGEKRDRPLANAIDYDLRLNLWAKVFGRDSVQPRLFDRSVMPGGDVVQDFVATTGLPMMEGEADPLDRNPSLLPQAQSFLSALAKQVRANDKDASFLHLPGRERVNRCLSAHFAGKGKKPARSDVLAYYEQVRESNARVRAAWFPERETLFAEDFSTYGETASPEPDAAQVLEVALTVIVDLIGSRKMSGEAAPDNDDAAPDEARQYRRQLRREKKRQRRGDAPVAETPRVKKRRRPIEGGVTSEPVAETPRANKRRRNRKNRTKDL